MPDFCADIRALLDNPANWVITNPAHGDVEFPEQVSRDYLTHNSRVGKSMVWVEEGRGSQRETQPLGGTLMDGRIMIYCYSRAKSSAEVDIADARAKTSAMRAQASSIIKANYKTIPGALLTRIVETDEWLEQNVDPWFYVKALIVQPQYEI